MVTISSNSSVAIMTSVFTGAHQSWRMSLVLRAQISSNMDEIRKARSKLKLMMRDARGKNKVFYR